MHRAPTYFLNVSSRQRGECFSVTIDVVSEKVLKSTIPDVGFFPRVRATGAHKSKYFSPSPLHNCNLPVESGRKRFGDKILGPTTGRALLALAPFAEVREVSAAHSTQNPVAKRAGRQIADKTVVCMK